MYLVVHGKGESTRKEKMDIDFKLMIKIPFVGSISSEFKNTLPNLFFNDSNIVIFPSCYNNKTY